jgi:hAT family C-terminal dimerisation region
MESLAADCKPTLDIVPMYFMLLIKHCDDGEAALNAVDPNLTAAGMKEKLLAYERILVSEPAIVASFLNPQIPKPTDLHKLAQITGVGRAGLQRRYSGQMAAPTLACQEPADTLFSTMFQPNVSAFRGNEVDDYLAYGAVNASKFIDVLQWWSARKNALPALYTMAMDYLGTPATSTPSERVNSAAGREFTSARQSLSSSIFIQTMCLRSWMDAGILKLPVNRAQAAADAAAARAAQDIAVADDLEATLAQIEIEQDDWYEEILDDGVVQMLNNQFEDPVFQSEFTS